MAANNDWPPAEFTTQLAAAGGLPRRFQCQAVGYEPLYVAAGTAAAAVLAYRRQLGLGGGVAVIVVPAA